MPYKNPEVRKQKRREWYERNKETRLKYAKEWRDKNKDKTQKYGKMSRLKNKDTRNQWYEHYYVENRQLILKRQAEYRLKNRKKILKKQRENRKLNKIKINEKAREYYAAKKNDIEFIEKKRAASRKSRKNCVLSEEQKFCLRVRNRINIGLKVYKKADKNRELLGCSYGKLREHLESQFTEGMTWENMGRGGWHIDHIIPCAFFDLSKPSHQKVCFNWQNLQPLWESDNCAKGDKIPWYVLLTILMNNYKTITV